MNVRTIALALTMALACPVALSKGQSTTPPRKPTTPKLFPLPSSADTIGAEDLKGLERTESKAP